MSLREGHAASATLARLCEDPEPASRAEAIVAPGRLAGGEARRTLEARLTREEREELCERIQRSLARIAP